MEHSELLRRYAQLIVRGGVNVQEGQIVSVTYEPPHRDLALLIAEEAYKQNASFVDLTMLEPRATCARINYSRESDLAYVPPYLIEKYKVLLEQRGASIRIVGPEHPGILSDLNQAALNLSRAAQYQAIKFFYDEGTSQSKLPWSVVAAPTPQWARRIYPDVSEDEAVGKLWDAIFHCSRVTVDDPLAAWEQHNKTLATRAKKLDALEIEELHFTGPDTDLRVSLTPAARFRGGDEKTDYGLTFMPNIPSEEVFTTPDARKTSGTVKATRPFLVNGTLIKNLRLTFTEGSITDFSATEGEEAFREYIARDDGAKRLGEVALVGIDSPIFQTGTIFEEILYDENAACHIAIGSAYKFCLEDGPTMPKEKLEELGCNQSSLHTDIMISSEEVSVTARTFDGQTHELIKLGKWHKNFN
jgi:aminopeptidase